MVGRRDNPLPGEIRTAFERATLGMTNHEFSQPMTDLSATHHPHPARRQHVNNAPVNTIPPPSNVYYRMVRYTRRLLPHNGWLLF